MFVCFFDRIIDNDAFTLQAGPRSHLQRNFRRNASKLTDHVTKSLNPLQQERINLIPTDPGADWRDLPNKVQFLWSLKLHFMKTSSSSLSLLSRDCCVWQPVRLQYSRQYPQYPIIISNCNSWKLLSSRGWGWRTVDRRGSLRTTTRRRMGGAGWTSLTICNILLMVGRV